MVDFDPTVSDGMTSAFVPVSSNPFLVSDFLKSNNVFEGAFSQGPEMMPLFPELYNSGFGNLSKNSHLDQFGNLASPFLQFLADELSPTYPGLAQVIAAPSVDNALQSGADWFFQGTQFLERAAVGGKQLSSEALRTLRDRAQQAVNELDDSWNAPDNGLRNELNQHTKVIGEEVKALLDEASSSEWMTTFRSRLFSARTWATNKLNDIAQSLGSVSTPWIEDKEVAVIEQVKSRLREELADLREQPEIPEVSETTSFGGAFYTWKAYVIKAEDTLSQIALDQMGSASLDAYNFIAQHNGIADASKIYVGQTIDIPFAIPSSEPIPDLMLTKQGTHIFQDNDWEWESYIVQSGDNLSDIAKDRLGDNSASAYNFLAKHNGMANPSMLFAGQVIEVPSKRAVPSTGSPEPSSDHNSELARLLSDEWDYLSGDNTLFDGAIWGGERDERHETPEAVKQVYTDLSEALFGSRYRMTAGYLHDQSYFNGRRKHHAGIDIDAPDGSSVKSLTSGTVVWVWEGGERGDFISIRGDDGREWVYGHLQDKGEFAAGQIVKAGEVIGQVGNQQYASHLHLEVRTGEGSTGGAHANRDFVRDVTMSPLQAFWELQSEHKSRYQAHLNARVEEEGSGNLPSIQSGEHLLDNDELSAEQILTLKYVQENEDWIVPELGYYWPGPDSGGFNDWSYLRDVPGVQEIAQRAEDVLWHLFNWPGVETANKHIRHFLTQGGSPEALTDIDVDDMLSALPILKQELDVRIKDVQEKLSEYYFKLLANGETLEPNQIHYINPLKFNSHFVGSDGEGENFWVNPKDGVSQPFSILEEVLHKEPNLKAFDYYNAINSFHYNTEMQFQIKEGTDHEIELRAKLHIHDHFNFDTKLPDDLNVWNVHKFIYEEVQELINDFSPEESLDKGKSVSRVVQSAIPEILVRLGMANNFEQWGESSEMIFRGKHEDDKITWTKIE